MSSLSVLSIFKAILSILCNTRYLFREIFLDFEETFYAMFILYPYTHTSSSVLKATVSKSCNKHAGILNHPKEFKSFICSSLRGELTLIRNTSFVRTLRYETFSHILSFRDLQIKSLHAALSTTY